MEAAYVNFAAEENKIRTHTFVKMEQLHKVYDEVMAKDLERK